MPINGNFGGGFAQGLQDITAAKRQQQRDESLAALDAKRQEQNQAFQMQQASAQEANSLRRDAQNNDQANQRITNQQNYETGARLIEHKNQNKENFYKGLRVLQKEKEQNYLDQLQARGTADATPFIENLKFQDSQGKVLQDQFNKDLNLIREHKNPKISDNGMGGAVTPTPFSEVTQKEIEGLRSYQDLQAYRDQKNPLAEGHNKALNEIQQGLAHRRDAISQFNDIQSVIDSPEGQVLASTFDITPEDIAKLNPEKKANTFAYNFDSNPKAKGDAFSNYLNSPLYTPEKPQQQDVSTQPKGLNTLEISDAITQTRNARDIASVPDNVIASDDPALKEAVTNKRDETNQRIESIAKRLTTGALSNNVPQTRETSQTFRGFQKPLDTAPIDDAYEILNLVRKATPEEIKMIKGEIPATTGRAVELANSYNQLFNKGALDNIEKNLVKRQETILESIRKTSNNSSAGLDYYAKADPKLTEQLQKDNTLITAFLADLKSAREKLHTGQTFNWYKPTK